MLATNNMHNLTNVKRTKSEMGVFSDYPHYFDITREGSDTPMIFGIRSTENGEFVISK